MIFTLILLILVWTLPINGVPIYEQRSQSQLLKFIAAIIVVLGHQIIFYCSNVSQLLQAETGLGHLCVAFFLFMSGYGLLYGYLKNKNLSSHWLRKRILKLIIPALTAMTFYLFVKVYSGQTIDWTKITKYWFILNDNLPYGWYVSEIICLYIVFYVCYRWVNREYALTILTGSIILAMFVMGFLQMPIWYIQGLPCFIMGLFLARHNIKHQIKKSSRQYTRIMMTLLVVTYCILKHFAIIQHIIPELNRWRYMYATFFIVPPLFVIIIAYILMRLPICNKLLNRGGYFYEIYLVQGGTLLICRNLIAEDWLFVLIGLIVTIVIAKGINMINNKIISFFKKE